jgi:hypothetical protein
MTYGTSAANQAMRRTPGSLAFQICAACFLVRMRHATLETITERSEAQS